jgi:hypothetical protein
LDFCALRGAEQWRSFDPGVSPKDRAKKCLLFFYDLPNAKVREYNAHYAEAEVILLGQLLQPHTEILQKFVKDQCNPGKFFGEMGKICQLPAI